MKSQSISPNHHVATCPICRLRDPQASRIVQHALATFENPYDVLLDLNRKGFTLQDVSGNDITTPNKWRDAMRYHMESCLQQDFETYERAWRKKKSDQRLQIEFREAAAAHGFDLPQIAAEAGVPSGSTTDLIIQRYVREDVSLNRDDLIQAFRNLLPNILIQQLAIVNQRQADYLSGAIRDFNPNDIKTVKECVDIFTRLVGNFGVQDTLE